MMRECHTALRILLCQVLTDACDGAICLIRNNEPGRYTKREKSAARKFESTVHFLITEMNQDEFEDLAALETFLTTIYAVLQLLASEDMDLTTFAVARDYPILNRN